MDNPGFSSLQRETTNANGRVSKTLVSNDINCASDDENKTRSQEENSDDLQNEKEFKPKVYPQLMAAFAALVGAFSFGCALGYSAVAMPKLRQDPNFPQSTEDEISWISSIITVGALCGCAPTGIAMDKFGRRKVMLLLVVPFVASWLLIYSAKTILLLMIGRFLNGFCGGSIALAAPIFIAETSEPKFRGMLINGFEVMTVAGFVFISVIGKFFEWRTQALVCSFIPLQALIILCVVPESPRFLLFNGREDKAFQSLCWFRGASSCQKHHINSEFETLVSTIRQDQSQLASGFAAKWPELTSLPVLKSFSLIFLLYFFAEFSGVAAVDYYTIDIFQSATTTIDPYDCCIIVHVLEMLFSAFSGFLMDRINRKFLTAFSELVMMMSLGLLGVFFCMKEQHSDWAETNLKLVPAISVLVYYCGYTSGMAAIPMILMPEILPQRVRGVASSLLLMSKWTMNFFVSRYFKNYMSAVGDTLGYSTFSAICFMGFVFGLIFLPKTNGKSLEQIQIEMNSKTAHQNQHPNPHHINSNSQTRV